MKVVDSNTSFTVYNSPSGYISFLRTNVDGLSGVYGSTDKTWKWTVEVGPKGKWSSTPEDSIDLKIKFVQNEVKKLSKKIDLRPSEVRRLEFLKDVLTKV